MSPEMGTAWPISPREDTQLFLITLVICARTLTADDKRRRRRIEGRPPTCRGMG
jgi:hypothetical protein